MKRFWRAIYVVVISGLVIGGLLTFLIAFYISIQELKLRSGVYSVGDATWIVLHNLWLIVFDPGDTKTLSDDQHTVLDFYGNSLVLFVSLAAIAFSTLAVRSKLAGIEDLLPYEKYGLFWFWRLLQGLSVISGNSWLHRSVHEFVEKRYVDLRVKKMVHYYKSSDRLLIVSGHYSWLLNSGWSPQARQLIKDRLPNKVCLISHRTPREVADYWKGISSNIKPFRDFFAAMSFTDAVNEYNGSVVKRGHEAVYLYLYLETHRSERGSSVCVFHGDREARALVRLVEDEFYRLHNAALRNDEREREKNALLKDPAYFG